VHRRRFIKVAAFAIGSSVLARPVAASGLAVPLFSQQHALSCEAASLRMALGALGVNVEESDILDRLAHDPTPRQPQFDGSVIWGDPDIGFVGSFDGVFARDGYGVYQQPIADVAASFGVNATPSFGTDSSEAYAAVNNGLPVVVWVPYGLSVRGRGQWTTPNGKTIPYVVTEHCVVLASLTDTGVVYADPWEGAFKSADYATFEAAFAEIGNRAVFLSA
jgi:uncharacterized protein YvpB